MPRFLALVLVAVSLSAQADRPGAVIVPRTRPGAAAAQTEPHANIRVDTTVVLVPVNVTDRLNRFITSLEQSDFQVLEDGVPQRIVSFGSQDAALSIGIVADTSGSMGAGLLVSRRAIVELFKAANPEDEAFLIEFNDRPGLLVPFTHNLSEIQNRMLSTRSNGSTALLDGVTLAIQTMKKARNPRKAIIVITDGGDNHSRYTFQEVINRVSEADVQIYAVGVFGAFDSPEQRDGPHLLSALSEPTGGHHFVASVQELPDIAAKIGIELRNEYLIGYQPSNQARDGKYRKITVKVTPPKGLPKLSAYWRRGYYAPTQ